MRLGTLGCSLLVLLTASTAGAQECPTGKPATVTRALPPVFGQTPLWVTAGSTPIKWEDPQKPVQLVWVLDATAQGLAMVTGKNRATGAALRFTKVGDTLGQRQVKYELNRSYKPSLAKPDDFTKYSFDRNFAWFPEPGCYEIAARVGRQQAKIYLQVGKPSGK